MSTTYEEKVQILAELWIDYKDEEYFQEFFKYNDLGMPLAYVIDNGIVESTPLAQSFVTETYKLLLSVLEIPEDAEIEDLDDLLSAADLVDLIKLGDNEDSETEE